MTVWDAPEHDDGRDEDDRPDDGNDGFAGGEEPHAGGVAWQRSPLSREEEAEEGDEPSVEFEQLALGEEEVALPWLEGDEDEEDEDGYATGNVLALVVLGIAVLALIVGAIWWGTRSGGPDPDLVADGSVIEAPDQPYKERPEDPGGKTFEGTGDTSFAVSEGQTRPAQLGDGNKGPKPGFETVGKADAPKEAPKPAATAAPKADATPAPAPASPGVGVQVGAFSTRATAEAGWSKLSSQYSALSGMSHRIVEGQADIGRVFRLQAVPGDAAAAKALCKQLKASGLNCQVKN